VISYVTRNYNPVTGCTPVGDACLHCWAARQAKRLPATHAEMHCGECVGGENADERGRCPKLQPVPFSEIVLHPDRLSQPLKWRKSQVVGVSFMGDLFHEAVPFGFLCDVFPVIGACTDSAWLILTKRAQRLRQFSVGATKRITGWPWPHLWPGVSAWDQPSWNENVGILQATPAARRWVSLEPLLGPVDVGDLSGIDWIVAGCESGPGARFFDEGNQWLNDLESQCHRADVPIFVKQRSGVVFPTPKRGPKVKVIHFPPTEGDVPPEIWRVLGKGR